VEEEEGEGRGRRRGRNKVNECGVERLGILLTLAEAGFGGRGIHIEKVVGKKEESSKE
jgi:hypothetical protein